jgi:hypothetical protein
MRDCLMVTIILYQVIVLIEFDSRAVAKETASQKLARYVARKTCP